MSMSVLRFMSGDNLKLINNIDVKSPKLSDIIELERLKEFDQKINHKEKSFDYDDYVQALTSTRLDVADILWFEMKIWYEDIENEWNFFIQKCILNQQKIDVFFEADISNNKFSIKNQAFKIDDLYRDSLNYFLNLSGEYILLDIKSDNGTQVVMCNIQKDEDGKYIVNEDNKKFTETLYYELSGYLKKINWMKKEYMFLDGGSKGAKIYILKHIYQDRNKKKPMRYYVSLDSIVSSLIAKGVNYKDIWDYPIYLIYDLYYRNIKIYEWQNTIDALHNGCIDTTKNPINWEQLNWGSVINLN